MRLLLDQNLSHRLIAALHDLFPAALHVRQIGMAESDDLAIWEYAKAHQLVIVTQDSDYSDWNKLRGAPPKIVWLRCGNASVEQIRGKAAFSVSVFSFCLRTTDHGPRTTDQGPRTKDQGPRTTDHGPRTTDHGPRTTNSIAGRDERPRSSGPWPARAQPHPARSPSPASRIKSQTPATPSRLPARG
ncbi:DUF5615 family PIN-like protein [Haloferula sargassicola]|uniref:DUF5615 family PIN-like protein n=1 Tax=Haloferula sargassicola TaxID=490096 RepID=UPI003365547C